MIGVTGATGHLGRLVIEALLARGVAPGDVVALARSPDKAADLAERGVGVREADYTKPDQWGPALDGVDRLLLISSSTVGERIGHHRTVVGAAAAAGVGRVAYTSILGADSSRMRLAEEHRATEEMIRDAGVPFVFLRNGWYMENYTENLGPVLEHGALVGAAGAAPLTPATRADLAAAAATVLAEDGHGNAVYELGGDDPVTLPQLAEIIGEESGREIAYRQLPEEEYAQMLIAAGLPEGFARVLADSSRAIDRGELYTDSGDLHRLIGRPTTSPREAVARALRD